MTEPWELGRKAMIGSLAITHVFAGALVLAVLNGRESSIIGDMFASCMAGIFAILATLVGGKAAQTMIAARSAPMTETVKSETVRTLAAEKGESEAI